MNVDGFAVAYSTRMPPEPPDAPRAFAGEPLLRVWRHLAAALEGADAAEIVAPDPDRGAGAGVGARLEDAHGAFVARPLRVWVDLAEALGCRLATPRPAGPGAVRLRFERLEPHPRAAEPRGRYGPGSPFAALAKPEDAASLVALYEALERAGVRPGARVLVLGVNRGDELAVLDAVAPLRELEVVGVDHDPGALEEARARWPDARFVTGDANELDRLELGPVDVALAVGLLQSPGVDAAGLLRALARRHLRPAAGLVLGFPNSRLAGGDLLWGARTRNVGPVELGLVLKDALAAKRYLQQQRFRVFVSGKYDLLVTGVRRAPAGGT